MAVSSSQTSYLPEHVDYLKLIPYEEARSRVLTAFSGRVLHTEHVPVDAGRARVCAEDISSNGNLPDRHLAAMDGYALASSNTRGVSTSKPLSFHLDGLLFPESNGRLQMKKGHAYYVSTGAPIPAGADAVVRVEEARVRDGNVTITHPIEKWKNVFLPGEDYKKCDPFFVKGRILSPADVALMISLGKRFIKVFRTPKVGILSVGDELTELGSTDSRNKTVNNYLHLIHGFLSELKADADSIGICPDSPDAISKSISSAAKTHDMIITIGGSSVGAKDFTVKAVSQLPGSSLLFHGVRIVPLRPTGLAIVAGKPVVILPANAISVAASFFVVALPVLNLISGLPFEARKIEIRAKSETSFENARPLSALYLATLGKTDGGTYVFNALKWGSNLAYNLSKSNGFVILEKKQKISKNQELGVTLFGPREIVRLRHAA